MNGKEREMFESWLESQPVEPIDLWRAWQARASLSEWQPIETAPKDGTWILAVLTGYIPLVVRWNATHMKWFDVLEGDCSDAVWKEMVEGDYYPSHWMPLPTAPNEDGYVRY